MRSKEDLGQFSPLLYYLQKNQIPELIRVMFNRKLSQQYLQRYGHNIDPPLQRMEDSRLQECVRNFQGKEIVHLNGSHSENVKYHVNTFVQECLRRKIRRDGLLAHEERRIAWLQLTECYQQPFLFAGLDQIELPPFTLNEIKKDIVRTPLCDDIRAGMSPKEIKMRTEELHNQLTNVLEAFAKYNPYVGYLQGMNNIVAFMLQQGFSEQQSFFLLKKITEQLLPCDYFSSVNRIIAMKLILCEILKFTHPQAIKQLNLIEQNDKRQQGGEEKEEKKGEGLSQTLYFIWGWFTYLFTFININRDVRRCVFDHFLLEGLPALLKVSLCYFDFIQPAIMNTTSLDKFKPIVDKVIKDFNNISHLKQKFNDTYVNRVIFDHVIDKFTCPLQKTQKRQYRRACDRDWTMCFQTIQQNSMKGQSNQFYVFKTTQKPKIIQNYLDVNTRNRLYFSIGKDYSKTTNLLIGRMQHCCCLLSDKSKTKDLQCNIQQSRQNSAKQSDSSRIKINDFKKPDELRDSQMKMVRNKALKHLLTTRKQNINNISKLQGIEDPEKRELEENKVLQQLQTMNNERQSKLMRSESMQFMMNAIKHQRFSNLMEILQVKDMNNLFRDCINQADEDDQESNI